MLETLVNSSAARNTPICTRSRTMKALVLSGGRGSRLRPITHTAAKQLIPVANKPILFYGLEAIANAGIRNVGIVVGDTHREVRSAVGDGSKWGIRVRYIQQKEPLGLAHAVKISKKFLGNSNFVMYLGDNLIQHGISTLVKSFRKERPHAQILLGRVKDPSHFGIAELESGRILSVEEKPKKPKSNLALIGVYMFDPNIFPIIDKLSYSWRGELEITDAIAELIKGGYRVVPCEVEGWWKDTGKLEDLLEANRLALDLIEHDDKGNVGAESRIEGKVYISEEAQIINSIIRGPVIIGKGCFISNSFIGPYTSVYYNVTIENSEIEHSIVLENSSIRNIHRIESSLIGQGVNVAKSATLPFAYRFMAGDSSTIEIP